MEQEVQNRTPGPKKNEDRAQYCLILDRDSAEWAKDQPDGISGKVRRFLNAEYRRFLKRQEASQ